MKEFNTRFCGFNGEQKTWEFRQSDTFVLEFLTYIDLLIKTINI